MVHLPRRLVQYGLFLLAGTGCFAAHATDDFQQAFKDEFIDMMRWEHLQRNKPIFRSPREWESHCNEFNRVAWKAKCDEQMKYAVEAEREAIQLLDRFELREQVRRIGAVSMHLPLGLKNREEPPEEYLLVWADVVGKLIDGYRSEDIDGCMLKYACTVRVLFDREGQRVDGVEVILHK